MNINDLLAHEGPPAQALVAYIDGHPHIIRDVNPPDREVKVAIGRTDLGRWVSVNDIDEVSAVD